MTRSRRAIVVGGRDAKRRGFAACASGARPVDLICDDACSIAGMASYPRNVSLEAGCRPASGTFGIPRGAIGRR
jgi:hypothetical protein